MHADLKKKHIQAACVEPEHIYSKIFQHDIVFKMQPVELETL